jgi:PTH2 family peptidyl-tRNA hydrolase
MRKVKQVIVIRRKFPDGKGGEKGMRRGKEIAQGSHASSAFLSRRLREDGKLDLSEMSEETQIWLENGFTKVCLKIDTEEEIMDLYKKASDNGLEAHYIVDSGLTEFAGEKTITALSIGPNYSDKIDEITSELKLY